jgi:ABC-type Fe3+-siderophore transport system permease subunit
MTIDIASPRFIDALLVFIALEAGALYILFPRLRPAADLWLTLASGAALMLAVRLALSGAGSMMLGAVLGAALAAHLLYLRSRLRK